MSTPTGRPPRPARMLTAVLLVLGLCSSAHAQWFADIMVQAGATEYQCGGIFGTFGPIGTVRGRLIQVEPYTGCEPFPRPPSLPPVFSSFALNSTVHSFGFWEPWIALVQRGGNCSFYDKIRHATQAGASAVIIGNVRVSEVVIMHDTRPVQIPAVSVSRAVAAQLEETATHPDAITLLTIGPQLTMVNFVVSEVLHDAAVFLLLLCGLTSIVTIVYYFRRRRFLRQLAQRVWARRARVAAAVNLLPVISYKSGRGSFLPYSPSPDKSSYREKEPENRSVWRPIPWGARSDAGKQLEVAPEGDMPESCAICLEDFTSGDEQRTLPCPHGAHFHRKCIDPWLTIHQTCPLCKTNFLRAAAADREAAPAEIVEAATMDESLEEEVSWEHLQQVDEMGTVPLTAGHSPC